jgi:hypothetical protein
MMLAQKLIVNLRKAFDPDSSVMMVKAWLDTLPTEDLGTIIYWNQVTANAVDSENVRHTLATTGGYYMNMYKDLIDCEESPYRKYSESGLETANISTEEFLWAFSIVGSRALVLNNTPFVMEPNPEAAMMILPLFDFINHSFDPNVIVMPYHDKINEKSYVMLRALRDIEPEEQLLMSYGPLANCHLLQKYGFTVKDNPNNRQMISSHLKDYQHYTYEEADLKKEIIEKLGVMVSPPGIFTFDLYLDKFD